MLTPLVICIGNVARGDDGVAHAVAPKFEADSDVRVLTAVGLDVAMACDVAGASIVIIVDAERRAEPLVRVDALHAGPALRATGHAIDAPSLLSLAAMLYGASPKALLVSLAAPEMGHGEGLSPTAEAASLEAASVLAALLRDVG